MATPIFITHGGWNQYRHDQMETRPSGSVAAREMDDVLFNAEIAEVSKKARRE